HIINGYFADKQPCLSEFDDLADLQYFSLLGSWQSPKVFDNAISSVIVRKQVRFTVILPFSLLYVASDEVGLHTVSIFDNQLDPRNE
ncbi:hypothetical protein U2060_15090, partial [Listeria monocytogenes]|uniref:hypothetical protein n=1 Tax=Listeria monocytogenes TaxID=1639 RepID=UPI002FDBB4D4